MKYDMFLMVLCMLILVISAIGLFIGYDHLNHGEAINMVLTMQALTLIRVILQGDKK